MPLHHPLAREAEADGGITGRATICVEAMEPATRQRLVDYLADTWGIRAKLVASGKAQKAVLVFASARRRNCTP